MRSASGRNVDLFQSACYLFLGAWAVVTLYPILYVISLSVRRRSELSEAFLGLVPQHVRWENYPDAFKLMETFVVPIPVMLLNSAFVTTVAVVLALGISVLASYAFARIEFRGRRALFFVLLLGLIVPIPVMLIPEFIVVTQYGLAGSLWSLIFPYVAFGLPLPILILTTFFKRLPRELFDAAEIDGASPFRVLVSIAVPNARPALVASALFLALQFWNEFPLALTIIQDADLSTVPLGLSSVQPKGISNWELIAAVILIASLPVAALFLVFQRRLVEGFGFGALAE